MCLKGKPRTLPLARREHELVTRHQFARKPTHLSRVAHEMRFSAKKPTLRDVTRVELREAWIERALQIESKAALPIGLFQSSCQFNWRLSSPRMGC
jgi:hypothetical protein